MKKKLENIGMLKMIEWVNMDAQYGGDIMASIVSIGSEYCLLTATC